MEKEKPKLMFQTSEIEKILNYYSKNELFQIKEDIKNTLLNNYKDKFQCQALLDKITKMINLLHGVFKENIQKAIGQYESIIRRDEQTIRILYKNILTYRLLKDSLDNRIGYLLTKEKEYELIKDKTGAFVCNGKIVYNMQKDNEIIILRTENSNLKNIIGNYEKIIHEKDLLYENIKKKYYSIQNKIYKTKVKKISIPNININLCESQILRNIDNDNSLNYSNSYINNVNNYLNKRNKSNKSLNNSDKNKMQNFNYLKYKNISKNKNNISFNNFSYKNIFQNSLLDLSPRDIFEIKKNNSKSKSNEKTKKISFEKKKDICSLKKKNIKIEEDAFQNHFKRKHFNLLQVYTANSQKNIKHSNSPISKIISNYSNDVKISNYLTKKSYSQKNNDNNNKKDISFKKGNKGIEGEILHKSYVNSIPYNKQREKYNLVLKKESNNNNKYRLMYCKTKKENNSKNLPSNKNNYKKYTNISTNKIFLPLNIIKK